ncbi:hypothetical protein [Terriglobus roseus]|uniref:Uncharacterized protein n=1 Tax=Terriglobus roseus TaxID=392734 RepID=A0A1G7G3W5_9BACT|nr:hypothetical protein [Terriglobus roseus]SDE82856.1 hypothetical protein SAMN05444167_0546 [Terriglobus roseus]
MNTNEILSAIDGEIAKLQEVRSLLTGYSDPTGTPKRGRGRPKKTVSAHPVKRVLSEDAKARIAAAQKKRWAAQKKATK